MTPAMRYKDIDIIPTEDNHLPRFWKILQSYPNFFCDDAGVKTENDFVKWFKKTTMLDPFAKEKLLTGQPLYYTSLTAIRNDEIIGCGYLDDIVCSRKLTFAPINIFMKKRSIKPSETAPMMRYALPYFFKMHRLDMIYGVTRIDNRACIKLLQMIGLKITGTLKKHKKVKGVLTDYVMSSILKEQVI